MTSLKKFPSLALQTFKALPLFCKSRIPMLKWIPKYSIRMFLGDFCAGVALSFLQIALGITCAIIATVSINIGIYTPILFPILYAIFGTSIHCSIGVTVVISLITGEQLQNFISNDKSSNTSLEVLEDMKEEYLAQLSFACGSLMVLAHFLNLGFIGEFFTKPFNSGLLSALGIAIITAQIGPSLGMNEVNAMGRFGIIKTWKNLIQNLTNYNFNLITVFLSIVTMIILAGFRVINKKIVNKGWPMTLPAELTVVALGIIFTKIFSLDIEYDVDTTGNISVEIPSIKMVNFYCRNYFQLFMDAFTLVILVYSFQISLVKNMAKKSTLVKANSNQEFLALGACHILGSFFTLLPGSAGPPRSAVVYNNSGKTQIWSFICSLTIAVLIYFFGWLFAYVPKSVLCNINLISVIDMLMSFKDLKGILEKDRLDGIIWFLTAVTSVIVSLFDGMLLGLFCQILLYAKQNQSASIEIQTSKESYECFLASNEEPNSILVIKFRSSLSKFNVDRILDEVPILYNPYRHSHHLVIIDMSTTDYLDSSGMSALLQLNECMGSKATVVFCGIQNQILSKLKTRLSNIEQLNFATNLRDAMESIHLLNLKNHATPDLPQIVSTISS